MKEYRLGSVPMVYAPGVFEYLRCGYKTSRGKQRAVFVQALSEGWRIHKEVAIELLSGKLAYEVKGDAVVFAVPETVEVFS
jgi:hypothetical protein